MAKPGLKITKENIFKLNATGLVFIEDGKVKMDISEETDGTDIIEIEPYLRNLHDEMITIGIKKVEVLED